MAGVKKLLQLTFRTGCLASVIAPVVAVIVYPRANWLFAFLFIGIAVVVVGVVTHKDPAPTEIADRAEHLLDGNYATYGSWAVDDYEHLNPKSERLKDLWRRTMSIGGLPEVWARLDEEAKSKVREVIVEIRRLESTASNHRT
jgi:hypothetical protein